MKKRILSFLTVGALCFSLLPVSALAADTGKRGVRELVAAGAYLGNKFDGNKPENGTSEGNPFTKGTAGSNSFRIPAMITLKDGSLLAAADARWNTTYDGGGLDTIVSRSTDGGKTWNYTFANYLGDNGNVYNGSDSTCFIDPSLAYDGETVYLLADLYPYGVALNGLWLTNGQPSFYTPEAVSGFNEDGKLLLKAADGDDYGYYLDGDTIYKNDGSAVDGYKVDPWFNIREDSAAENSNLFFKDAPFQVQRTSYLYLVKSTDNGQTWSAPTLIDLKSDEENAWLVAPGRGLVMRDGTIIFPTYSYKGTTETQCMDFVYSVDGGKSWKRSMPSKTDLWSSESAVVELEDGTLRFFYRNASARLSYIDYDFSTGWGEPVREDIPVNSNCQISAITYSKTVKGKQVVLVSCPTGPNRNGSSSSSGSPYPEGARFNGEIFVGLVNADGTMNWLEPGTMIVNDNNAQFMYSCLTERRDGSIALLFEDKQAGWGVSSNENCNTYYTMDFKIFDMPEGLAEVKTPKTEFNVGLGDSVKLTVDASAFNPSDKLTYQWYQVTKKGNVLMKGATEGAYRLPDDLKAGTYQYVCTVTCGDKEYHSAVVTVTVDKNNGDVDVPVKGDGKVQVKKVYNYGGVVTWNAVKGAKGYEVHCGGKVYKTAGSSYALDELDKGTKYTVTVYAVDKADKKAEIGTVTFKTFDNHGHEDPKHFGKGQGNGSDNCQGNCNDQGGKGKNKK